MYDDVEKVTESWRLEGGGVEGIMFLGGVDGGISSIRLPKSYNCGLHLGGEAGVPRTPISPVICNGDGISAPNDVRVECLRGIGEKEESLSQDILDLRFVGIRNPKVVVGLESLYVAYSSQSSESGNSSG